MHDMISSGLDRSLGPLAVCETILYGFSGNKTGTEKGGCDPLPGTWCHLPCSAPRVSPTKPPTNHGKHPHRRRQWRRRPPRSNPFLQPRRVCSVAGASGLRGGRARRRRVRRCTRIDHDGPGRRRPQLLRGRIGAAVGKGDDRRERPCQQEARHGPAAGLPLGPLPSVRRRALAGRRLRVASQQVRRHPSPRRRRARRRRDHGAAAAIQGRSELDERRRLYSA